MSKPVQIEHFIRFHNIDILNCQKINSLEETFKNCNFIMSIYENIPNNATKNYGTSCIVSNTVSTDNIKVDNLSIFNFKQSFRLLEIGIQNLRYKINE